jgi:glycosyltransferase involved in cell wall biosynthesis
MEESRCYGFGPRFAIADICSVGIMSPTVTIDARMLGFSGIGRYLESLLENLGVLDSEFQFQVICSRPELLTNLSAGRFRLVLSTAGIYSLREQWEILRLARGTDLLHCPHYNVPYFYRGQLVVTIHDLNHLMYPEFLPGGIAYTYARVMYSAATRRAARIITDSQFSARAIREHLGIPGERIQVIYLGLPEQLIQNEPLSSSACLQNLGINRPYVLSVGILKPHKNFQALIRAFALLPADVRRQHKLVIAGKRDTAYPELLRLTRESSLEQDVVFTGHVSDADLSILYSGAAVFALPSLNEGFGLPALEAMAYGVPVVVSNTSALPEVVGDAGRLVNPHDERGIATAIEELLRSDELRTILSRRSKERAKLFSARRFALEHLEVYRDALC